MRTKGKICWTKAQGLLLDGHLLSIFPILNGGAIQKSHTHTYVHLATALAGASEYKTSTKATEFA